MRSAGAAIATNPRSRAGACAIAWRFRNRTTPRRSSTRAKEITRAGASNSSWTPWAESRSEGATVCLPPPDVSACSASPLRRTPRSATFSTYSKLWLRLRGASLHEFGTRRDQGLAASPDAGRGQNLGARASARQWRHGGMLLFGSFLAWLSSIASPSRGVATSEPLE